MTNNELATKTIQQLVQCGVRTFIVCAGARNAPFVKSLGQAKGLDVQYFFDERAASFFALGRAKSTQAPVAVVTTSGTAVSETISAAIEAHYSGQPIVLVTADRPRTYRGRGAPQAIEQVGIFSHYCRATYDLSVEDSEMPPILLQEDGPTHVNVCFSEPLLDRELHKESLILPERKQRSMASSQLDSEKSFERTLFRKFLNENPCPLVLCGEIPLSQIENVRHFLVQLNLPIYAEATSQLWKFAQDLPLMKGGTQTVEQILNSGICQSVLRIGGVPTLRAWRDFEEKFKHLPVFSVNDRPYSGLARESLGPVSFSVLMNEITQPVDSATSAYVKKIMALDETNHRGLCKALDMAPASEVSLLLAVANKMTTNADVFLGNSLPIREWDLILPFVKSHEIQRYYANRGANGIDGLIATSLGAAAADREMWTVIGDLSALYDLNALAVPAELLPKRLRIVVVNNSGGMIFRRMFNDSKFENSHSFEFSNWAKMFGFEYLKVQSLADINHLSDQARVVVEVVPQAEQSERFWKKYEEQNQ